MLQGKIHSTRYTVKLSMDMYLVCMSQKQGRTHMPRQRCAAVAPVDPRKVGKVGIRYSKQNQSSSVAEDNRQDRQMIESVMMMMMAMTPKLAAVVVSLVPGSSCSHAGSHELLLDLTVLYGH